MQLSFEDVKQVAVLARLELSPHELSTMTYQLNDILEQFARLQELDTDGIRPTAHSGALNNVFRADIVRPSLSREDATANAPDKRDGNFIVPQVVSE